MRALIVILSLLCLPAFHATADDDTKAFGSDKSGEAALMGIFYDLTQTQDGKPTGIGMGSYGKVLTDFVKGGWNENDMDRFYRASKPLFTTQIWIPTMPTTSAPRAFGVEKRAPHALWVIHYKGQIVPPEDGTYRFVGYGDDVLVVALNEKILLVSDFTHLNFGIPEGTPMAHPLKAGEWFDAKKSEPMDLDVLCCDNGDPRGVCASFILIEQKGKTYDMKGGHPLLPVFQVAPYDTPDLSHKDRQNYFEFSHTSAPWKALQ